MRPARKCSHTTCEWNAPKPHKLCSTHKGTNCKTVSFGHVHTLHHSAEKHGEMVTCAYNKKANQCTCKCMMRSAPAAAVQTAV